MSEMIDLEEAVERACGGDRDAFANIVRACHIPVRAVLTAIVHDRHDADDLAQQTFVYAVRRLDEFRPGTNFLAWIKAVARTLALDFLKRRRQRRAAMERYLQAEVARRAAELAGPEGPDLRVERLQRCIEGLSAEQRSFLRLAHDRTSSLEAIAQRLRRSGVAVRKQLSRLHEILRNCIAERMGGEGAAP